MRGARLYILLIGLMLLCSSRCMAQRVEFKGFERITHLSTSGANLWVEVENRGCWRMVVKEAEVDILVGDKPRLTLSLRDRVVVPRKSRSEVLVPLRFTSRSMLSFVGLVARMAFGDRDDITVNYRIKAGTPIFKRRFEEQGIPLNRLLELMDMSEGEIDVLNEMVK
ncbi:MAG: hypothetical protein IKK05_00110 [Alistipes sp.]|nr:hypothetical protein [Alistipes sp.]